MENGLHNEMELIRLVASGSEVAFTRLFDFYKNDLYYLAFSITRSADVSADVLQEVFLKIWIRRSELVDIENFRGYLVVVTRRVILNELRKQERLKNREDNFTQGEPTATTDDAVNQLQEKQYSVLLDNVLQQLPAQQATVFRLIKLQGYSREMAAQEMGLSPETVKKHLERAVRTVRAFMLVHLGDQSLLLFLILFQIS